MTEIHTIALLGCGWLGFPLALRLLETGYRVRATTTRREKVDRLQSHGIDACQYTIEDSVVPAEFLEADLLIINIPSKDEPGFKRLLRQIESSSIRYLIFISSTSVYPENAQTVHEDQQQELPDHPLSRIEHLFEDSDKYETTVIRFAGLVGYNRHPGRFFRNGRKVPAPMARVNLIHRDDCIGIIEAVIHQRAWPNHFNASADTHPSKREFYSWATAQMGLPAPQFADQADHQAFKIIANDKVRQQLGYRFQWPDVMQMTFEDDGL